MSKLIATRFQEEWGQDYQITGNEILLYHTTIINVRYFLNGKKLIAEKLNPVYFVVKECLPRPSVVFVKYFLMNSSK